MAEVSGVSKTKKGNAGLPKRAGTVPRGIRSNNPGNIIRGSSRWLGMVGADEGGYCVFSSALYGIRAMAIVLLTYQRKYGLNTVRGIISRWAPKEGGNDVEAYIAHVCKQVGVTPGQMIDVERKLPLLVPAIILHENGQQPYGYDLISNAIKMATK